MAVSDIDKVGAQVVWTIGARDESSTFDRTTTDDRFDDEEIARALVQTESEIMRTLAESYHPYRQDFLSWSSLLSHGDTLPAHFGQIESIEIRPYAAAETYILGQAESRENIRYWRENYNSRFDAVNHDVFGSSLAGYYCLTNQTIEFTGNRARVKVFTYTPDYATPALQLDEVFDSLLVHGAIPKLHRLGVPSELILNSSNIYGQGLIAIRQGLTLAPDIQLTQQVGK